MASNEALQWYVAVLVVRARIDHEWQDDCLVDHQVRVLRAPGAEAAYDRALQLGAAAEQSYPNADGALVRWEFCGLADLDVLDVDAVVDGTEVYSWRSRGQPGDAVLPKEKLAVFWIAANGNRTVEDLLE